MDKTLPRVDSTDLPIERCSKCSICRTIPNKTGEFWKGGELDGDGLPESVKKLIIIGAPYYDDSTSHSNSCLKRCPECGTFYRWDMEYEYLVNGSEDDINLYRLSDTEGLSQMHLILESVKKSRQEFIDTATTNLSILNSSLNIVQIKKATDHLYHYQLVYEEDITFAVPAVINALVNHKHNGEKCDLGQSLFWLLQHYTDRNDKNREYIIELIKSKGNIDIQHPEVRQLLNYCNRNKAPEK